jgi:hypothetical protein
MSCSELVLSAILRSSVVSVLGSCVADPHSSPRLCSFFLIMEVKEQVERGRSDRDKYNMINSWTYDRFTEQEQVSSM